MGVLQWRSRSILTALEYGLLTSLLPLLCTPTRLNSRIQEQDTHLYICCQKAVKDPERVVKISGDHKNNVKWPMACNKEPEPRIMRL